MVLAASGGTSVYLLPVDGNGGLEQAEQLKLAGAVTTLVAGEINRADGLVDLVLGVRGPDGPALLVFEGPEGALPKPKHRAARRMGPFQRHRRCASPSRSISKASRKTTSTVP